MEKPFSRGAEMIAFYASFAGLLLLTLTLLLLPMARHGNRRHAAMLAAFITVGSLGLYALWGAPGVIEHAVNYNKRMGELQSLISTTSALIKQNPNNLEAWLTLSQAFSDSGDYAAAANGFKQAVLLSKGHPRIIMAYSESLILQAGGAVTAQAKKSIDIALMIDPKLPLARYYKAVWLLQQNRQAEAMQMMKELYNELPDDSSLKKRMKAEIGKGPAL